MRGTYVAVAGAIILFGIGAAFFFSRLPHEMSDGQATETATSSTAAGIEQSSTARVVPEGMREYRSSAYHFSIFYPQELTVSERPEGGGATTITFQNIEKVEGFQIFIVPYGEPQVSEQRFRQDEPSGVRESLTTIAVDGATGAAFYSKNGALGNTREIWFTHNGFLYEMTTLKTLDTWLADIMRSWKFI